jgi:hypothetical protein
MGLSGGVVGTTYRAWKTIDDGRGAPKTGLPSGAFTVTIVAIDDSASTAATVTESTQAGGLYYFDIPGSFLTTHGAGEYGVHIVIATTPPQPRFNATAGDLLKVTQQDIDKLVDDVFDETALDHDASGSVGQLLNWLRRSRFNKLVQASGDPGTLKLYNDAGDTVIATFNLHDEDGNAIDPTTGVPAQNDGMSWPPT